MFASHRRPGRAFAVTLAICLIAVATVTVYSLRDSLFAPGPDAESQPAPTTTTTTATTQPHKDVVDPVTGVPDDRTQPPTTTTAPAADLFVLPVSNTVSVPFSRDPVYNPTMGDWRTHNGVDFAAEIGDTVMSVADGRVLAIAEDTLWGSLIRIQHGDLVATYCGVETAKELQVDDEVKAGETIGCLTIVPCELLEGGHLHLELMAGQDYVDPLTVITGEVKFK